MPVKETAMTLPIAILGAVLAAVPSPSALSPRETAVAVLFAADEAAVEPHLLAATREQLALLDPDVRAALMAPLRPLGALQQREGVTIERFKGKDALARVLVEGETVEVGLGPEHAVNGMLEIEMTVGQPKGGVAYVIPMKLCLRKEEGAWRVARADYGVNPFHLDSLALVYWLDDPQLAQRVQGSIALRNARAVIGDMRTVVAAEMAYSAVNAGFFDAPACLEKPSACLSPVADLPQLLSAEISSLEPRSGYDRSFHPGPPPSAEQARWLGISASSLSTFAYVAVPTRPGVTGTASFCADSMGRVCVQEDGGTPAVVNGLCEPCRQLD
jgi:hypothetical protein